MPFDPAAYPAQSELISPALEGQLKLLLDRLTAPVQLTCLLDGGEKSREMASFLNHLAALSPKISCRYLAPGEEPSLDTCLDSSLLPATGVSRPGETPRMVFHGIPGGKEINAFAAALLAAGGASRELDKPTLKDIGKIKKPLLLHICVSLGCQHCAQLAAHAQRIAWENELVSAHVIDANLYPELVENYSIQRVPLTVIDRKIFLPGGKTMAELTSFLRKY